MTRSDQALLADYLQGGDDAFRQLLERHSGLVYGVALRQTGDAESAREVAQDVFLVLARKARRMIAHPSVAAWLHRTTRNIARDAVRTKLCHERKVRRFAREAEVEAGGDACVSDVAGLAESVDQAVARLPEIEKEAILLRFFEDREYAEVAQLLKISEPAARKRVSRALHKLQNFLGSDAIRGTVLAAVAVAAPASVVASILPSIPAAHGGFSTLAIVTIMTKSSAIKIASVAIVGGGLLFFGGYQTQQRNQYEELYHSLQKDLGIEEGTKTHEIGATPDDTPSGVGQRVAANQVSLEALRKELEIERKKRSEAEAKLQELVKTTEGLGDEIVVAFGNVEEVGGQFGSLFTDALTLRELEDAGKLDSKEGKRLWAKFVDRSLAYNGVAKEVVGFEDKVDEGAPFFAASYASVFDLDEEHRAAVQGVFEKHLPIASEKQLTLANAPEEGSSERESWNEQRWAYFERVRDDLRSAMPANAKESFDLIVEDGGYGFKNLKLNGIPLHFGMGGKQTENSVFEVKGATSGK